VLTRDRIRDWLEAGRLQRRRLPALLLTIGLAVGCSETHAIRCVRELEKAGDLEIERAPRGSKRPNHVSSARPKSSFARSCSSSFGRSQVVAAATMSVERNGRL
jgi:hypothetical protein